MSVREIFLFINLGTPETPEPGEVGDYLKEFLMDPNVIDVPRPLRDFLVKVLIVPRRKYSSSEAYKKVWMDRGSPLKVHSEDFTQKMSAYLPAKLAMRYGQPSIASVVREIVNSGIQKIFLVPLYPQYASSSTGTAISEARRALQQQNYSGETVFLESFYAEPFFIHALSQNISATLENSKWDHVLFSYHGLPKRHLQRLNPDCGTAECCARTQEASARARFCYKYQASQTTSALVQSLGLRSRQYSMAFQSRLGPGWIQPFTDKVIAELPTRGVRNLVVACPSFVADCLETLEEIQIRAVEIFKAAGGESLRLVPSLNSDEHWVDQFASYLKTAGKWRSLQ